MSAPITAITMPKWGLTMTEGKVVQWLKQPGASFAPGEELLEIETSKITNVVEADAAGTLTRIVAPEGTTLPIGALLAVIAPADTPAAEIDAFVSQFVVVEPDDAAEDAAAPAAPRELRALGRTLRCLEMGSGDGVPRPVAAWLRRRSEQLDVQSAGIVRRRAGHSRLNCRVTDFPARMLAPAMPRMFTDVIEAALVALDVERVHVVGHSMGGALAVSLAARQPERIATLTLLAPAGLGPEINGGFIDAFVRASRRKDAAEALQFLVHDASLISRAMVEDVLRYKRLDGVAQALETIARAWFPQGRQAVNLVATLRALAMPVQVIWGRDDRIIPVAHAEAAAPPAGCMCWKVSAICRTWKKPARCTG